MNALKIGLASILTAIFAIGAAQVAAADNLRVTNLGSYSGLNMRSGPGTGYSIVTTLPHNARNINWTCRTRTRGNSTWYEIDWRGYSGWASSRYLKYMRGSHRHCTAPARPTYGNGSGNGHGHSHGVTHSHSHSHGGHRHTHVHTHHGNNGHNVYGHSGGNHGGTNARNCQVLHFGSVPIRLCMR